MHDILRHVGLLLITLAALAAACIGAAFLLGDGRAAAGLAVTALASGLAALIIALTSPRVGIARRRDGFAVILVFWLLTPFLVATPFLVCGVSSSFGAAYFEAASNLTTTGISIAPGRQPDAILLWRACLQWLGGTVAAATAIAILGEIASTAAGNLRARAPYPVGLGAIKPALLLCGGLYFVAAALGAAMFIAGGTPAVEAIEAAVALATTSQSLSGLVPQTTGALPIGFAILLVGAGNARSFTSIGRDGPPAWRHDPETPFLLLATLSLAALAMIVGRAVDLRLPFEILSLMATSGMSAIPDGGSPLLPQPIPECLVLIGGSALSTAGGIKIVRVLTLGDGFRRDIGRLCHVHSRVGEADPTMIIGAFVYMSAFAAAIALLTLTWSAAGLDWPTAFRAGTGLLTNTGPMVGAGLSALDAPAGLTVFSAGCLLLGRIEILALAPLFTSRDFR